MIRDPLLRRPFLNLALLSVAASLTACTGLTGGVIMAGDAAGIYSTRPDKPPPPDLAGQIPPHQSWCYRTLGNTQCYSHPQNVSPERLVMVDPPNAYPLDVDAYKAALNAKPAIAVLPAPDSPGPTLIMAPDGKRVSVTPTVESSAIDSPAGPMAATPARVRVNAGPGLIATPDARPDANTVRASVREDVLMEGAPAGPLADSPNPAMDPDEPPPIPSAPSQDQMPDSTDVLPQSILPPPVVSKP
jgi:hypothetical protein